MVGALEVRLEPGRRTVVVTEAGQNEVRGDPQTPEKINALLEDVLTSEARRGLASGWAEWEFDLVGKGPVRATAELKKGRVHAGFQLARCHAANGAKVNTAAQLQAGRKVTAPRARSPIAPAPPKVEPAISVKADELSAPGPGTAEFDAGALGAPPVPEDVVRAFTPTQPSAKGEGSRDAPQLHDRSVSHSGSTEAIDALLLRLLDEKASDLHVSTASPPMLRRDGDMAKIQRFPVYSPEQVQRLLWPIVPPRNREEFGSRHDTDFAYELVGRARFRVNLFMDLRGMGAVFRVIPSKILTVEELNLPKELLPLCQLPKGLVLVTGPTGSGKSTTLAALVDHINETRDAHIITIEDPVEFVHQNKRCLVNQRQVGEHTKSFKGALRAALREDPDIVLLGEMRDLETVAIAMETAETGHLVFGTLHTSSAPATVDRIIDQFPSNEQNQIRVMLANSLKGVISQMLCKRIGGGRVAALEVMFGIPAISNLIREAKVFQIPSIMQTGRSIGMRLMNDHLLSLVKEGLVEPSEALNKSIDRATLTNLFKQNQIKV